MRGLDLADQLIAGRLSPAWGRTVGIALYVSVAVGALLVALSPFRHRWMVATRIVATGAMLLVAAALAILDWFPVELWGIAPILAMLGLVVAFWANIKSLAGDAPR